MVKFVTWKRSLVINKEKKYIWEVLFIITLLVTAMYGSYAFFVNKEKHHGKLNIVAETLDYKIESSDLTNKSMYCYNCEESNELSAKTISTTNVSNLSLSMQKWVMIMLKLLI